MPDDMNNTPIPAGQDGDRAPKVFAKGGAVFASSRDVAEFFGKNHRDVMRAVDSLVEQEPDLTSGPLRNFAQGVYILPETGTQQHRMFDMTRDGFTLLAMGFTGAKALKWKLRYIEAFNMMEAELRSRPAIDPMAVLNNPAAMRGLLLTYSEKVLTLESQVEAMRPDVAAHERLAKADGSLNVTEAAKNLGMRPGDLFDWLSHNGWIYKRPGASGWLGYQDKCNRGLLEHKSTTVTRADGSEKITEQVRITPKGLSVLAKLIFPSATLVS